MQRCDTHQKAVNRGGQNGTMQVGCDFTGGANGSPIIFNFKPDQAGANNYLRSLVTDRIGGQPNKLNVEGPQLQQDNFGNIHQAAINEPCT